VTALFTGSSAPTLQTSDASGTIGVVVGRKNCLFERDLIIDALKRCNGNMAEAARDLKPPQGL